jgi:cell fate (sporulation/competence/biofilm development) regulator YlbF (YheA/YmcA/DUF963 family)
MEAAADGDIYLKSIEDLEEAAEYRELRQYLRLDEEAKKPISEADAAVAGLVRAAK